MKQLVSGKSRNFVLEIEIPQSIKKLRKEDRDIPIVITTTEVYLKGHIEKDDYVTTEGIIEGGVEKVSLESK